MKPLTGTFEVPSPDVNAIPTRASGDNTPARLDVLPNGRRRAHLDERFADLAVVSLGAGGVPFWTCVHSRAAGNRFLRDALPPAPPASGAPAEER